MNRPETDAEHRRVASKEEAEKAEPGEILVDEDGNVVIGAPTAAAAGEAPQPGGEG